MKDFLSIKNILLEDLEKIFRKAMKRNNLSVALKTKELLAKLQGIFPGKTFSDNNIKKSLAALSDEELLQLLEKMENT